jgi:hypothetical protein
MKRHLSIAACLSLLVLVSAGSAGAASCDAGLACQGILPASSAGMSPVLPTVAGPRDLTNVSASGYYAFTKPINDGGGRAVAYVVLPGTWSSVPSEIKQLPLADDLLPAEKTTKSLIIYGPGTMESWPWAPDAPAAAASTHKKVKAHTAAASDCTSPWFCLFNDPNFGDHKCQWQSTGSWQIAGGCYYAASSMVNRRGGYSLIERAYADHYCALPNSQDASLSNNGYNDNATETYLSTASTYHSEWACTNV